MIIERINPYSLGRVMGWFSLVLTAIGVIATTVVMLVAWRGQNYLADFSLGAMCWSGFALVMAYPLGFFEGWFLAILYNAIVKVCGGVEIDLVTPPPKAQPGVASASAITISATTARDIRLWILSVSPVPGGVQIEGALAPGKSPPRAGDLIEIPLPDGSMLQSTVNSDETTAEQRAVGRCAFLLPPDTPTDALQIGTEVRVRARAR